LAHWEITLIHYDAEKPATAGRIGNRIAAVVFDRGGGGADDDEDGRSRC